MPKFTINFSPSTINKDYRVSDLKSFDDMEEDDRHAETASFDPLASARSRLSPRTPRSADVQSDGNAKSPRLQQDQKSESSAGEDNAAGFASAMAAEAENNEDRTQLAKAIAEGTDGVFSPGLKHKKQAQKHLNNMLKKFK